MCGDPEVTEVSDNVLVVSRIKDSSTSLSLFIPDLKVIADTWHIRVLWELNKWICVLVSVPLNAHQEPFVIIARH